MADNRSVPMPPDIKAELARLRALMIPDAEAYRRREIGSKRMEEEAKKIQPLRPLSAADTDVQYPLAAKGGRIQHKWHGGPIVDSLVGTFPSLAPVANAIGATKVGLSEKELPTDDMYWYSNGATRDLIGNDRRGDVNPMLGVPLSTQPTDLPKSIKMYRADPTGKYGGKEGLETLPQPRFDVGGDRYHNRVEDPTVSDVYGDSSKAIQQLYRYARLNGAANKYGYPSLSPEDVAAMALKEGRSDLGFNAVNLGHPDELKFNKMLRDTYNLTSNDQNFLAALFAKQRVADKFNIPFAHAWNGTGVNDAGQSGKDYAKNYEHHRNAALHPNNQQLMDLVKRAIEDGKKHGLPLRENSIKDSMRHYIPVPYKANGGQIRVPPSDADIDALFEPQQPTLGERFNQYVAPIINSGLNAVLPMRKLAGAVFEHSAVTPAEMKEMKEPFTLADAKDLHENSVNWGKFHMENGIRKRLGLTPLPERRANTSRLTDEAQVNSFPNPNNPIPTPNPRDMTTVFSIGKAEGGVIDMDRMRLELMNGKKRFLEPSKIKERLYRGQRKSPKPDRFVTTQDRATPSFTTDPEVANVYSRQLDWNVEHGPGSTSVPVHIQSEKPFDIRNLGEHLTLSELIDQMDHDLTKPTHPKKLGYEDLADILSTLDHHVFKGNAKHSIDARDSKGYKIKGFDKLADEVMAAGKKKDIDRILYELLPDASVDAYALADSPEVVHQLKKQGYDSMIHKDVFDAGMSYYQGDKSKIEEGYDADHVIDAYRPFNQNKIKSAIGNRGTYDINDPDITKKRGGRVTHAHQLEIEERPL